MQEMPPKMKQYAHGILRASRAKKLVNEFIDLKKFNLRSARNGSILLSYNEKGVNEGRAART